MLENDRRIERFCTLAVLHAHFVPKPVSNKAICAQVQLLGNSCFRLWYKRTIELRGTWRRALNWKHAPIRAKGGNNEHRSC